MKGLLGLTNINNKRKKYADLGTIYLSMYPTGKECFTGVYHVVQDFKLAQELLSQSRTAY